MNLHHADGSPQSGLADSTAGSEIFPLDACPVELLCEIFNLCDGGDIAKVFCCGSKRLNLKLQGPRTVLSFVVALEAQHRRKWPSIISYFHGLRKIAVKGTFPTHFEDIFGLPKSLESIDFSFWEAESCFTLPPSKSVSNAARPPFPMEAAFIDMSLSFPSLRHLKLDGSGSVSDYFISKLPRGLETLHISSYTIISQALITLDCLNFLPPDLTSLKMVAPFFQQPEHFAKLPRSLLHLELLGSHLHGLSIFQLPPNLQSLILPDNALISRMDIPSLPRTLQVLDLSHNMAIDKECFGDLPCGLKDFLMWRLMEQQYNGPIISMSPQVAQLPPTLTRLKIQHARYWGDACMAALPQGLLHLTLHRVKNGLSNAFAALLPRTLLSLALFCEESDVQGSCFADLPPGLRHLELSCAGKVLDEHVALLPRSLVTLDLAHAETLTDACTPQLPPQLKKLYLRHNNRFTSRCAPALPRGLTFLSLSSCTSFSSSNFKELPSSLTHLGLNKVRNIYGSDLGSLPDGIRYLDITSAPSFDARYLPDLPKRIINGSLPTLDLMRRYNELPAAARRPSKMSRLSAANQLTVAQAVPWWRSTLSAPVATFLEYLSPSYEGV